MKGKPREDAKDIGKVEAPKAKKIVQAPEANVRPAPKRDMKRLLKIIANRWPNNNGKAGLRSGTEAKKVKEADQKVDSPTFQAQTVSKKASVEICHRRI